MPDAPPRIASMRRRSPASADRPIRLGSGPTLSCRRVGHIASSGARRQSLLAKPNWMPPTSVELFRHEHQHITGRLCKADEAALRRTGRRRWLHDVGAIGAEVESRSGSSCAFVERVVGLATTLGER